MTVIGGRVDQPGPPVGAAQKISAPQIAVQQGRGLFRAGDQRGKNRFKPAKGFYQLRGGIAVFFRQAQLKAQPLFQIKTAPLRGFPSLTGHIFLWCMADKIILEKTKTLAAMAMHPGQGAAKMFEKAVAGPAGFHPFHDQVIAAYKMDGGNGQGFCLAQFAQAVGFRGEHARMARAPFGEKLPPIAKHQAGGLGNGTGRSA